MAVEDIAKIRVSAEIQVAKRDRGESDARSKDDAEIREKAENTKKRAEAETIVGEKANDVQTVAAEVSAKITVKTEVEREKRDRA